MAILDILLLIPFLWFGFKGLSNGFFKELFSTLALFLALYVAIHFSSVVGDWIASLVSSQSRYFKLTVLAITFICSLLLMRVGVWIADKFFSTVGIGWLNKLLGLAMGIVKAFLIVSTLLYLTTKFDKKETLLTKEAKEQSLLYKPVNSFIITVYPSLTHFIETCIKD